MEKYYKQYDACRQNEQPFCTVACPFHVDVLDFQTKMAKSNYNAAFKAFRNAVAFPDIVAALCPEYCASACPRKDLDHAVQLSLLEKTCVAKATKKDPNDYNVPMKNRKIAIVGAGTSGLACAVRLAQKKYNITIYEKSDRLGGKLWDMLPSEVFLTDIERQLQFEKYTLHFNTEVHSIDEIRDQGFEAIYIATGKDGLDFDVMNQPGGHCRMDGEIAVFAGGSLIGKDPVRAIADGLDMAWAIEVFLKTARLEYPQEANPCRSVADPDKLIPLAPVTPTDHGLFTDEETAAEAERCIRCQCDACMKYCDVCNYHKKWPMKIRDDIMATVAFSTSPSMLKKTPAKRLMNACTQCGLCDEVCPEEIEIGAMLLEARRNLHKQNTMPGAYHQFWVNDMEFTNGAFAALTQKPPEAEGCEYAFFPGCQLGAADPRYVREPYRWLLSKRPDVGLLLRCCGVPAEWAGNEEMHEAEINVLRSEWESLGKPVLITACPACGKHLGEYLPEIRTVSLYEILDQWEYELPVVVRNRMADLLPELTEGSGGKFSVFDPCTARHMASLEGAVRHLAETTGIKVCELPKGDLHGCCGFGGHVAEANPEYYHYVANRRSELSEDPYLVYCINCRDVFAGEGKPVLHILDLLFGIRDSGGRSAEDLSGLPALTQRRANRTLLKESLLWELWGETMEYKPEPCKYNLKITEYAAAKMEHFRMLEADLCEVIELGERSGRKTFNPETATYSCYRELGHITYWVEYRKAEETYEIVNVYSHRMKIRLEGMWNGRKTEIDL